MKGGFYSMADDKKYLSSSGLLYVWSNIKNLLLGKVDKVDGKQLSTNDYTNEDRNKLAGIPATAQENVIESIKVNGVTQAIDSKAVDITMPTKTSDIINDSDYQNSTQVNSAIATALSEITSFEFQKVDTLPATGTKGVIYLMAHSHDVDDGFDEFIWIDTGYEKLGHTDIDLSGYMQISNYITNEEIDAIIAT